MHMMTLVWGQAVVIAGRRLSTVRYMVQTCMLAVAFF
jgi:hypothetical protein